MATVSKISIKNANTQTSFKFMLVLAQCFGMFPVDGISSSDSSLLHFHWFSFRTFYTFVYLCFLMVHLVFMAVKILTSEAKFMPFVTLLFFSCSFVTTVLFLNLAGRWPHLMRKWQEVDRVMSLNYGFPRNLGRNLKIVGFVVMFSAAIEHSLYCAFAIGNTPKSDGLIEALNFYFENNYDYVFKYLPYNFFFGCLMQIVNVFSTFTWNYMDLFIMLISIALASRFSQITERIRSVKHLQFGKPESFWLEIREDYNRLNLLCKSIDDSISNIVFLSFANNLFVLLVQLLNSLEPTLKESLIERFYFLYSFAFLIIRTSAVSLYAAGVDEESKSPVDVLNSIPEHVFNTEIERLVFQIKMDPSSLSGRKLFKVTKSLILTVAGAIVTYELILIQFNIH